MRDICWLIHILDCKTNKHSNSRCLFWRKLSDSRRDWFNFNKQHKFLFVLIINLRPTPLEGRIPSAWQIPISSKKSWHVPIAVAAVWLGLPFVFPKYPVRLAIGLKGLWQSSQTVRRLVWHWFNAHTLGALNLVYTAHCEALNRCRSKANQIIKFIDVYVIFCSCSICAVRVYCYWHRDRHLTLSLCYLIYLLLVADNLIIHWLIIQSSLPFRYKGYLWYCLSIPIFQLWALIFTGTCKPQSNEMLGLHLNLQPATNNRPHPLRARFN